MRWLNQCNSHTLFCGLLSSHFPNERLPRSDLLPSTGSPVVLVMCEIVSEYSHICFRSFPSLREVHPTGSPPLNPAQRHLVVSCVFGFFILDTKCYKRTIILGMTVHSMPKKFVFKLLRLEFLSALGRH